MATNPDNVGVLQRYAAVFVDDDPKKELLFIAKSKTGNLVMYDDAIAYGELCRAAPAGGDARTVPFSDWMEAQHELGELRTMLARSAPAGSGEVLTDHGVKALDRCCGELRQFIELAGDYDLDEMAVQALETAIESMELRKSAALSRAAGQEVEPTAWRIIKPCGLRRHMTQSQYDANPAVQKWYEPFRCASCREPAVARSEGED